MYASKSSPLIPGSSLLRLHEITDLLTELDCLARGVDITQSLPDRTLIGGGAHPSVRQDAVTGCNTNALRGPPIRIEESGCY